MSLPEQLAYLNDITPANPVGFPERHQMAAQRGVVLNLYVPVLTGRSTFTILPGSAIVGLPLAGERDRVLVYFEGDKLGTGMEFATKVHHAADRMVTRYPTVATAVLPASELRAVGMYDVASHGIHVTDEPALTAWRNAEH